MTAPSSETDPTTEPDAVSEPGPGKVGGPVVTHPVMERPLVWVVLNGGARVAGVEHARGNGGRSVLVVLGNVGDLPRPVWVRASAVEPRA